MDNTVKKYVRLVCCCFFLLPVLLYSQLTERPAFDDSGPLPWFFVMGSSFLSQDSMTTDLIIQTKVSYDRLIFVKADSLYLAQYELSCVVFNKNNIQVGNRTLRKQVTTEIFESTNANDLFDEVELLFTVLPGEKRIELSLMDKDLRKTASRTMQINVPDYLAKPVTISSIRMLDKVEIDSTGRRIPFFTVSNVLNKENESFPVWFDVYNNAEAANVIELKYQIVNADKKTIFNGSETIEPAGKVTEHEYFLEPDLPSGSYIFSVETGRGRSRIKRTRRFKIHYKGMPAFSESLDLSVRQLLYVASSQEMNVFKKASSEIEKKDLFLEFWKKRDPSPMTPANELMEEYYRRVDFANRNFGKFTEGWKTDRGRVYMILGGPDVVDRHPFEPNTHPYEVWYYNGINRQFVFVDEHGFGDYYLTTPQYDILNRRD